MQELIAQLARLYLPAGPVPDGLAGHLGGGAARTFDLTREGRVRALVIGFDRQDGDAEGAHWQRLCDVANALQAELALPAPAVSISGEQGFRLWLSFEQMVPVAVMQRFADLLQGACLADLPAPGSISAPVAFLPCLNPATGKWAAFIHPGMGASFAEEAGLEVAPPAAAQAAFLEPLQSIGTDKLEHALARLQGSPRAVESTPASAPQIADASPGLLLKDATLEDIVRHLHSKNIEPTFRHLLPPR
ncbi:MAG: hypothetical protein ACLGI6_15050 [Gammaproteobacteria bacterium]